MARCPWPSEPPTPEMGASAPPGLSFQSRPSLPSCFFWSFRHQPSPSPLIPPPAVPDWGLLRAGPSPGTLPVQSSWDQKATDVETETPAVKSYQGLALKGGPTDKLPNLALWSCALCPPHPPVQLSCHSPPLTSFLAPWGLSYASPPEATAEAYSWPGCQPIPGTLSGVSRVGPHLLPSHLLGPSSSQQLRLLPPARTARPPGTSLPIPPSPPLSSRCPRRGAPAVGLLGWARLARLRSGMWDCPAPQVGLPFP